jgi:hypothetical protein
MIIRLLEYGIFEQFRFKILACFHWLIALFFLFA